jgi:magnesium transporter
LKKDSAKIILKFKRLIADDKIPLLREKIEDFYPVDLLEILEQLEDGEIEVLVDLIAAEKLADILAEADYDTEYKLLQFLDNERLSNILDVMYSDDVTDLLGALSIGQAKSFLNLMKEEEAEQIQRLLGYDEESAGGIMTTEYIAMKQGKTVAEAIKKLRDIAPSAEMIYYIYVINRKRELVGVLSMRELIASPPDKKLSELMHSQVITVDLNKDQEEVAKVISKYDLLAVPVVNKEGLLLGIITFDDILDVIEEEATEDMYKMAATTELEFKEDKSVILNGTLKRLPWLVILLFGDLLSGTVIRNFEGALESVVALAFFIPVLMDMGGNVGTQSLTMVVRGLATGNISKKNIKEHLFNEIRVGFLLASILGTLIALLAILWQGNPMLGLVVGLAMFCTLLTAVIGGTAIPFIINLLGADPAVAAGPFITTLVDVSGLFIYFTLATIFLQGLM